MWSLKAMVNSDRWSWGSVFQVGGWRPQEWVAEDGPGSPWPERGADGEGSAARQTGAAEVREETCEQGAEQESEARAFVLVGPVLTL